ncbi:hypothetical protein H4Q32_000957 [Labeo rohita]|uniref:Putative nuclease HARBI1 n=1 Tax=Labeo rohita TaxID=84645 RepID=A0ABQ8MHH3_LABRO|nr:hypothetical protein H4Q32_000957 [Labeo rohita]
MNGLRDPKHLGIPELICEDGSKSYETMFMRLQRAVNGSSPERRSVHCCTEINPPGVSVFIGQSKCKESLTELHLQAIPVQVQVLSVLGFLATGTFQREIGDRSGISQSTFSRILPDVLRGIIGLCPQLIRFPYSAQEQRDVRQDFLRKTGFPNVIGAIDCTHVAIRAPHVNEYMYVNRKNFHSINVQLICDARMAILNAVARWPGSTHDSFIVRNCSVGNRLEAGAGRDGWLLGDRGYPLKTWLLTPIAHTETAEEAHFNTVHARARSVVERSIGMLKGRWRCLDASGERLLYDPEKVCQIILACCVLHNMCLNHGIELLEEEMRMDEDDHPPLPADRNAHITALRRREVIHQLYQQSMPDLPKLGNHLTNRLV